ncbi:MAG: 2Fe-2S iron-sulfur cluster-binding protein [Acidobacteriota bacterium]
MKFTIDNIEYTSKKEETVLDVVLNNDLYIPHICSHPELIPYGGCRLCIVEIEGVRGYPTACTTYVSDGMSIITNSKKLNEMRKEVLQLILSEHPSGCLVCEEDCSEFMGTIKKVGVTTGCRWCPQDKNCELQDVVEYIGVDDTEFTVSYREFPVEKDDPFFDRDYNLCIYCGRCVRICNEYRKSSVISLKQRGKLTTIGPSFSTSHIDANCEFCGACVSVCPTGTLSEKAKKWSGPPAEYAESVCTLCSLKCKIKISLRNGRITGTLPPGEIHYSAGDLCVKGRFCISEILNSPERQTRAEFRFPEGPGKVKNGEALKITSEMIKNIPGDRIAVFLSPDLTSEEIAASSEFSKLVLKTDNITSDILTPGFLSILPLIEKGITFEEFNKADSYVSLFFNGNYGFAPATLTVKREKEKDKSYLRIGWLGDTASLSADRDINLNPAESVKFLTDITKGLKEQKNVSSKAGEVVEFLRSNKSPVFLIGLDIITFNDHHKIISLINEIINITGSEVFIPDPYGNLRGLLKIADLKLSTDIRELIKGGGIDLLYLIGDIPYLSRPPVKHIIYQNPFKPPDELHPDIVLPMAILNEVSGRYEYEKNGKHRIKGVVELQGKTMKCIDILNKIKKLSGNSAKLLKGDKYLNSFLLSGDLKYPVNDMTIKEPKETGSKTLPYILIQSGNPHPLFGTNLSKIVNGMRDLVPEDTIVLNPFDGAKLKVEQGDMINIKVEGKGAVFPIKLNKNVPGGFVYMISSTGEFLFERNPVNVNLRRG